MSLVYSCKYCALGSPKCYERIFTSNSYGHAVTYINLLHCQDKLSVRSYELLKIECVTLLEV